MVAISLFSKLFMNIYLSVYMCVYTYLYFFPACLINGMSSYSNIKSEKCQVLKIGREEKVETV